MIGGWLERWTERHLVEVGGISMSRLFARVVRRFLEVRVMGLAAEMTYYAVFSSIPLIGAIGVSLGFLERWTGAAAAQGSEDAILGALRAVFSSEVTSEVIAPLVQGLLRQERAGFAFGGFMLSLLFASGIFRSAIETLDTAYGVNEPRGTLTLWALGTLFALCAILVAVTILAMVVVVPMLGGGQVVADRLGLGPAFEVAWTLARWPTVCAAATVFLTLLYRYGPNAKSTWRECLPGAAIGTATLVLVAIGFRVYIEATGLPNPEVESADDAVRLALQVVGALMVTLFWQWMNATAVLTGGVVNAELIRLRHDRDLSSAQHPN